MLCANAFEGLPSAIYFMNYVESVSTATEGKYFSEMNIHTLIAYKNR